MKIFILVTAFAVGIWTAVATYKWSYYSNSYSRLTDQWIDQQLEIGRLKAENDRAWHVIKQLKTQLYDGVIPLPEVDPTAPKREDFSL